MKVSKAIATERKTQVWALRIEGYTYKAIAEKLGITDSAVHKMLQRMTREYRERHLADVERTKTEQVAQLEQVGFEAYQAWTRSKEAAKLVRQKKSIDKDGKSMPGEQTLESRDQDGDPRYLQVYMRSKEDIRKIIGADAPTTTQTELVISPDKAKQAVCHYADELRDTDKSSDGSSEE